MSLLAFQRLLFDVYLDPSVARALAKTPRALASRYDLDESERRALLSMDAGAVAAFARQVRLKRLSLLAGSFRRSASAFRRELRAAVLELVELPAGLDDWPSTLARFYAAVRRRAAARRRANAAMFDVLRFEYSLAVLNAMARAPHRAGPRALRAKPWRRRRLKVRGDDVAIHCAWVEQFSFDVVAGEQRRRGRGPPRRNNTVIYFHSRPTELFKAAILGEAVV